MTIKVKLYSSLKYKTLHSKATPTKNVDYIWHIKVLMVVTNYMGSTGTDPDFWKGGHNWTDHHYWCGYSENMHCYGVHANTRGSGGMPPRKFWKLTLSEIESEDIFSDLSPFNAPVDTGMQSVLKCCH